MIKCQFEFGGLTSLRHVTVDVLILRDNQLLLNKRGFYNGKPILESGKWGLIGGFVDRDETITEAIQREAMEEAGCKVKNLKLFRIVDDPNRPKEDRQNITFVFVAEFDTQIDVTTEEVKELKWFDLDDLPSSEEIAFDHGQHIEIYKQNTKNGTRFRFLNFVSE